MPEPLANDVVNQRLSTLPGWRLDADRIVKTYAFDSFSPAFGFACRIGLIAERQNHHPRVCHSYATVEVACSSHDAGGVTERDLELAGAIETLASSAGTE